ncbi:hypothetical protein QEN19_002402 [Hanseniaspora menglaensis]
MTQNSTTKDAAQIPMWKSLLAGGLAGVYSRTLTAPMERAKIILQINTQKSSVSTIGLMTDFYKKEGIKGLFRGNGINCLRVFPYMSIQYFAFQSYKNHVLAGSKTEIETKDRLVAGFLSGVSCVIGTYPLDLLKSRMTIQTMASKEAKNATSVTKDIYLNEGGILAFYRGMWPTLVGVVPFVILNFSFYEKMKYYYMNIYGFESFTNIHKLCFGATAGSLAQIIIYPFDLLRRRFQIINMPHLKAKYDYTSITDALIKIYRRESFFGLYKGLAPNLMKVIPATAFQWWIYECLIKNL